MKAMQKIGLISVFPEHGGVLRLDDGMGSSFYLLEGNDAAVLIDTGMADEPLRPVLEQLTDKPVTVLITHGHPDHMYHADEFDRIYIEGQDIGIIPGALRRMGTSQSADVARYQRIKDGDVLHIGGLEICVLGLGGHTTGSVLFYETSQGLLFTGDAVGSGIGVWMHLKESLPISQYQQNLSKVSAFLASLSETPSIFTGHHGQRYMGQVANNPVCAALVKDMEILCTRILEGTVDYTDAPQAYLREGKPAYVAEHGRASIVFSEESIA